MKTKYQIFRCFLMLSFLLWAGGCATQPKQTRYQVDMVSDLIMMFPGADHKESHLEIVHRFVEKDPQGNTLVEVTIDSIQAGMKSLAIKIDYDSRTDQGPIPPEKSGKQNRLEKYRLAFTGLASLVYQAKIDRDTSEVTLLDLPKRLDQIASGKISGKVSDMFGGDQVSMLLSRASLKDYAAMGYIKNLDQPWFLQGNTIVPGVASVNTNRNVTDEQKGTDPNYPRRTKVSFTLEESGKKKTPSRKKTGMQLASFEGQGYILRDRGPILRWEEKSKAHVATPTKTNARRAKKKKKRAIYYIITKTIQKIEP